MPEPIEEGQGRYSEACRQATATLLLRIYRSQEARAVVLCILMWVLVFAVKANAT